MSAPTQNLGLHQRVMIRKVMIRKAMTREAVTLRGRNREAAMHAATNTGVMHPEGTIGATLAGIIAATLAGIIAGIIAVSTRKIPTHAEPLVPLRAALMHGVILEWVPEWFVERATPPNLLLLLPPPAPFVVPAGVARTMAPSAAKSLRAPSHILGLVRHLPLETLVLETPGRLRRRLPCHVEL